jgi:hypothetical protein
MPVVAVVLEMEAQQAQAAPVVAARVQPDRRLAARQAQPTRVAVEVGLSLATTPMALAALAAAVRLLFV